MSAPTTRQVIARNRRHLAAVITIVEEDTNWIITDVESNLRPTDETFVERQDDIDYIKGTVADAVQRLRDTHDMLGRLVGLSSSTSKEKSHGA